jgi:hypothetical protein
MEANEQELGPTDVVVIGYTAASPKTGEAIPILLDVVDRGMIRVLDARLVRKEDDESSRGST